MNISRTSKGIAMVLAAALVGGGVSAPAAATKAMVVTPAGSASPPDQTYENGYGRLVVTDVLVPSAGRHERRTTFTSFRGGRFELSTDMVSGEMDVVMPTGSVSFHFLPYGACRVQVGGTSGPVSSAVLTKDGVLQGAGETKFLAAMRSAVGPSRQVVDDLLSFLAIEGYNTGAQVPESTRAQAHAFWAWASPACNEATLLAALAVGAYFGAIADGAGWLTLGSLWGAVIYAYNNELVKCQIP